MARVRFRLQPRAAICKFAARFAVVRGAVIMSSVVRDARWPFVVVVGLLVGLGLFAPQQWRNRVRPITAPSTARTLAFVVPPAPSINEAEVDFRMEVLADSTAPAPWAITPSVDAETDGAADDSYVAAPALATTAMHDAAAPVAPEPSETPAHDAPAQAIPEPTVAVATEAIAPPTESAAQPAVTGLRSDVQAEVASLPSKRDSVADLTPGDLLKPQSTSDVPVPLASDEPHDPWAGATWPMPRDVIDQLHDLAQQEPTRPWAGELSCVLDELRNADRLSAAAFAATSGHLRRLLVQSESLELAARDPKIASQIARVRFALDRRHDGWIALHALQCAANNERVAAGNSGGSTGASRDPSPISLETKGRRELLAEQAAALLADVEAYESSFAPEASRQMIAAVDSLAQAEDPVARKLAAHVASHYRNANFRVAVSSILANRFLPQPTETGGEIDDFVAGVPVHGRQRTRTRLFLRLLPDERNIRIGLEAHGEVDSDTAAESGPATLYTTGETRFLARKLMVLDNRRWRVFPATADARSDSELTGVRTDFDPLPIVNSIVHSIVRNKHAEKRQAAELEVADRVSTQARGQLDGEADPKLSQIADQATARFVEPLTRLGLQPTPIALATTDQRLIFRYRLAGAEQLGGHTPRPRAPGDSWLSMQVHESSVNNALDNLALGGRKLELGELYELVTTKLGRADLKLPDDAPASVFVTFAAERPISVRFVDQQAYVTLKFDRIDAQKQTWRHLTVIAIYEPEAAGLDAKFVRNEPIRLSGKNLTTRSSIVLRGVFSKMFTCNRELHLLPDALLNDKRLADLTVRQLVVHDGWLGLAIAPPLPAGAADVPDAESARANEKAVTK
jgi:hypothetical protein